MVIWLLLAGCVPDPCAGPPMTESEGALLVTEDEHPDGWGHDDCAACHAIDAIHREGCTPGVDPEALAAEVDASDCSDCHGGNGVAR